jgi:hypothetical protein
MQTFEVWREGYRITGNSDIHYLMGTRDAETFEEACIILLSGDKFFNPEKLTYWSCRLFDNASEAAEAFG